MNKITAPQEIMIRKLSLPSPDWDVFHEYMADLIVNLESQGQVTPDDLIYDLFDQVVKFHLDLEKLEFNKSITDFGLPDKYQDEVVIMLDFLYDHDTHLQVSLNGAIIDEFPEYCDNLPMEMYYGI